MAALASILDSFWAVRSCLTSADPPATMIHTNGDEDEDWGDDGDAHAVLSLIEENDYFLDKLRIGSNSSCTENGHIEMELPRSQGGLSRLGDAIGRNEHIRTLCFDCSDELFQATTDARDILLEGIKRNRSITKPVIWGNERHISDGAGYELLQAFSKNATNFTRLELWRCGLDGGAVPVIASFLKRCMNLEKMKITSCSLDSMQLGGLITGIMSLNRLHELNLNCNHIGREGCEAIAMLLRDPCCKLRTLRLQNNEIDNHGAIILANSLAKNDMLEQLDLQENSGITSNGWDAFSQLLCNTSSARATYLSNHTLSYIGGVKQKEFPQLASYLHLNRNKDKTLAKKKKLLQSGTYVNMKPFFEYDLKLLPLVIDWMDKATLCVENKNGEDLASSRLFAIYQFIKAHPPHNSCSDEPLCLENNDDFEKPKFSPIVSSAVASCMLLGVIKTAGLV